MAETSSLEGPDLTQGIPLAELPDGGMVLGHAGGEAVLVARSGAQVFAVGATCTHYSGALAEGLRVGDQVRCPWHHACFDLRTGEAVRAPALSPIACWRVERDGDRVVVREKRPPPVPPPARGGPSSVVIVGAGAAGNAAAEMLRRQGYAGPVTLIAAEDSVPVDRPNLSKDYLAGSAPEDWVRLRDRDFYAAHKIDLLTGVEVERLDPKAKRVVLAGGRRLSFGALLLATGAEPVRLEVPGADQPHVHYLRSFADSRAIIAAAEQAKRAVVVGASFIGLEVAASLRARKLETHVIGREARPLERVMGRALGDFIRALHEEHGVRFHLGRTLKSIAPRSVTLDNDEAIEADLVVVGIGVRPRTALAEQAGLKVEGGVLVDSYLRSSVPDVYAAGDVARWPDPHGGKPIRVEHWVVAERLGQVAARNIVGAAERFSAVPFFWSQHYDVSINYVGHAESWEQAQIAGSLAEKSALVAFRERGRIAAVASVFRDQESLAAELALERDDQPALEALMRH